jgi:predicted DNA-binding transcriptional regulator AlpA
MLRLGVSRRTLYRFIQEGKVPPPIRWGCRVAWTAKTFNAFVCALESGWTVAS